MQLNCNCKCLCNQKLLTNTSKSRGYCSGCIIGNCRGKGLFFTDTIMKRYQGGRFEITSKDGTGKSLANNLFVKDAYPETLHMAKYGFYEIPTKDSLRENHNEEKDNP